MKKLFLAAPFLFALGMSIYAAVPVLAQATDTPGPTMTPVPFFGGVVTTTPLPNVTPDSTCYGMPSGWGTVTPSALWLSYCIQCVYGYSTPTSTPSSFGTATAIASMTATPVPTATPTVTATAPAVIYLAGTPWMADLGNTSSNFQWWCDQPIGGPGSSSIYCTFSYGQSGASGGYVTANFPIRSNAGDVYANYVLVNRVTSPGHSFGTGDGSRRGYANCLNYLGDNNKTWTGSGFWVGPGTNQGWGTENCSSGSASMSTSWEVYLSLSPLSATPTPFPTAIPGAFCSSVLPEIPAFGFSGFSYGAIACIDIGPIDWSSILPSWIPSSWLPDIPHLAHICFQDLDIGVITLFGLQVSLSTIAYIFAIAAFIYIVIHK